MDIAFQINKIKEDLAGYGYDSVTDIGFGATLGADGELTWHVYATCRDEFQSNLAWDDKCQVGTQVFLPNKDGIAEIPYWFKSREQRELEVIVKRLGRDNELAKQMGSAAGREFARRITEELQKHKALPQPTSLEIPF